MFFYYLFIYLYYFISFRFISPHFTLFYFILFYFILFYLCMCVCVCKISQPSYSLMFLLERLLYSCMLQYSAHLSIPEYDNSCTIVLDRSYVPSRETLLQERMPLRQKSDATAQRSYCTGVYGKMRAVLEAESNTTPLRVLLW